MRVMYVINTMGRGGAEVQVRDLAIGLVARGHAVAVAVLLPFEDFEEQLQRAGVETMSLGLRRGVVSASAQVRLVRFARRFRADVIHGHMFAGNFAARTTGAILRAFPGRRPYVVCTGHIPMEKPARYRAYRATDFLCDRFTFVSREGLLGHQRNGALPRHTGIVVPNGVDLSAFHPPTTSERGAARDKLGLASADFVWLAVGSFRDEQKDYGMLLRAFARARLSEPRMKLLIAGEGRLLGEKRAQAAVLGIEASVQFLGLRSDVGSLMHAADAFVMSSAWEGLPIVLLEAAASGLPMVVTDVGGNADVVEGGGGRLVPARDSNALAEAMSSVVACTPADRSTMSTHARHRAETTFAIAEVISSWETIYADPRGASVH